jgi:hypothetical protein
MQTPYIGVLFANGLMLVPEIVDEYSNAWPIFFENPSKRLTFATLVTIDWRVDAYGLQLLGPRSCTVIKQIGEDNDIGMLT